MRSRRNRNQREIAAFLVLLEQTAKERQLRAYQSENGLFSAEHDANNDIETFKTIMNIDLYEAKRKSGVLQEREDGKFVLVRQSMIDLLTGVCTDINGMLAEIPKVLTEHGLSDYNSETLQREILALGYDAVERAVHDATLASLDGTNLFPELKEELATRNAGAIPHGPEIKKALEDIVEAVKSACNDLDFPRLDLDALIFADGSLKVPADFVASIAPRYTIPVKKEDIKTIAEIRKASATIASLAKRGIQVADRMLVPPRGGNPILAPGLITRMASGAEYTDAELLGCLMGIELTH